MIPAPHAAWEGAERAADTDVPKTVHSVRTAIYRAGKVVKALPPYKAQVAGGDAGRVSGGQECR